MSAAAAAATTTTTALIDLQVGDKVALKRDLNHPAFRDQGLDEDLGTVVVTERREVPAIPGWGGRDAKTLVRLPNGFWYDCATGIQENSGATCIRTV